MLVSLIELVWRFSAWLLVLDGISVLPCSRSQKYVVFWKVLGETAHSFVTVLRACVVVVQSLWPRGDSGLEAP